MSQTLVDLSMRYIVGIVLISIVCVAGSIVWFLYKPVHQQHTKTDVELTIFIHGTVGTEFNLFSPFKCLSDTASEDSVSTRLSRKFRTHPYLQHDQLLAQEGVIEVPYQKIIKYQQDPHNTPVNKQNAWYHIVSAYDRVAQKVGVAAPYRHYLLYGWSGLLSNRARQRAGYDLYHYIVTIRQRVLDAYGVEPQIRIIAHSHGGNVALWAAQVAHEEQAPFSVNLLYMMGTPIQEETVSFIRLPFYTCIISCYSLGDGIQGNDCFSTYSRCSFKRMSDFIDLEEISDASRMRADMQYVVNLQYHQVTHANMWLMGRDKPIFDFMEPLPLVALAPAFFSHLEERSPYPYYQAHLHGARGYCVTQLIGSNNVEKKIIYRSPNLYPIIAQAQKQIKDTWTPADDSRNLVFNYQNFSAMWHAFGL